MLEKYGKVRCDLDQTGDVCGNCRRRRQTCRRRGRSKYPARSANSAGPSLRSSAAQTFDGSENGMEIIQPDPSPNQGASSATSTPFDPPGYVGELSFMSPLETVPGQPLPQPMGAFHARFSSELLRSMDATSLPPKAKVEAFTDAYFEHIYHRAPIVDRADLHLEEPSMLISQAICMVGSLLRHPSLRSPLEESEEYYCKAKALVYSNYEMDHRNTLKALCLLIFRNVTPPNVLTLDCSWQWTGMATRLAYQMGLHRESTYSNLTNPGSARRMMWFLFVEDKAQSACFGRPSVIRTAEMDLRPLQLDDFESQNLQAEIFIEYVKLNMIMGHIVDRHGRQSESHQEQV
ncbi:uncharacterized protein N7503_009165 [Penicillium pulvis]|uniref:uncharacterized protein n=1 Tax=Penicillium pulvis TaxID=1562058 RepID=UPI002546B1A6|nr:uncharacterized protein N7503_009165 [Penicillium pulvis]KAJ5793187.1 hypothetical protein N7503_009165 [Penicillium pulvis]